MLLAANGCSSTSSRQMVRWNGTRPVRCFMASHNAQVLILMRPSARLLNPLLSAQFCPWHSPAAGRFISWMSRMPFSMAICPRQYTAPNLPVLRIALIQIMCAGLIDLFMVLSKPRAHGTAASPHTSFSLVLRRQDRHLIVRLSPGHRHCLSTAIRG